MFLFFLQICFFAQILLFTWYKTRVQRIYIVHAKKNIGLESQLNKCARATKKKRNKIYIKITSEKKHLG
jgi:hypothetical protein